MNNVLYDWLTFTTKIHSLPDVIDMLGFQNVDFQTLRGRYCYQDRLNYDGINILYNGRDDMGICVELSGQGCRDFETLGNGDYDLIFEEIKNGYSDEPDKREMNITRLDVAYDDFDGVLDLNYLMQAAQRNEYVSRCKDIEVIFSNKGCSVCHGSRHQSNVYVRIYDKKVERQRDDLEHWVRCELKLKDETALGFIRLGGDIRDNYFNVLNNYLRYIVPTENTTNKRMVATSPEWLRFIETWESVSVFAKPGTEYNIMKLDSYITNQLSGAISTYINVVGMDNFAKNITEAQKGKPKNPKYKELIERHGTASDDILSYLAERGLL